MIRFTRHAEEKFAVLKRYGLRITKQQVVDAVSAPDDVDRSRLPLLIAQKHLDLDHVLRVVYKAENNLKTVITFYPGRIKQYGKKPKS